VPLLLPEDEYWYIELADPLALVDSPQPVSFHQNEALDPSLVLSLSEIDADVVDVSSGLVVVLVYEPLPLDE
jgi:hypothetical protein